MTRIFQTTPLAVNSVVVLDPLASHHLVHVLRSKLATKITLFNGSGGEYTGTLVKIDKKTVTVQINSYHPIERESPLDICLVQGISRGEKMDYTIQKAVELGVKRIIPLQTERSTVKLAGSRAEQRLKHWQAIVTHACEQCGRNQIPEVLPLGTLAHYLPTLRQCVNVALLPDAEVKLTEVNLTAKPQLNVFIGPEGGFSPTEIASMKQEGLVAVKLGPRILRTETAAVAALTALQCLKGDF